MLYACAWSNLVVLSLLGHAMLWSGRWAPLSLVASPGRRFFMPRFKPRSTCLAARFLHEHIRMIGEVGRCIVALVLQSSGVVCLRGSALVSELADEMLLAVVPNLYHPLSIPLGPADSEVLGGNTRRRGRE